MNSSSDPTTTTLLKCCNANETLLSSNGEANSTSGLFSNETTQAPAQLNFAAGDKLQIVSFIIGTVGFFLNILVVVIIALYRPMHKLLTNIIIANQSAMDAVFAVVLVVGTYYQPDPTKILVKGNVADEILCRVWYTKTPLWGMLISTTYGIVLLTFDRYLAVVYPIFYKTKIAKNMTLRIVVLTTLWFLGPSLHSCFMIPLGNITADHTCNLYSWPNKMVSQIVGLCSVIIQYFFPLGVFIFCYSRMAWVLHRRVEQASDSGGHTTRNESMARARSNVFKTMALVSLMFVLCWTLSQMYWFLFNLGIDVTTNSDFYNSTVAMIFINCCTSPIIYIVKYESFQKGIQHVLFCNRIHPTNDAAPRTQTVETWSANHVETLKFTTIIATWLYLLLYRRTSVNPGNTKGVNLTSLGFFKFSPKPPEFFGKKLGNPRGFNLWSFDVKSMLGVDSTQSYGKNTKSSIQDFYRFCYKNLLKIDF